MKPTTATATAENVLIAASPLEASPDPSALPGWVIDDGLPPPTHANVAYWRQLCGVLSLAKGRGVADGQWPDDLAPPRPTLTALVERGIIVRRKRAWHLKRDWYTRLTSLRQRAVPTPRVTLAERPRPDLPSYLELEGIERICRWLDAQPKRRARLPFIGLVRQLDAESDVPTALLLLMRKHRLARHTSTCEWALSPTWKERLLALWKGVERELRQHVALQPSPAAPFVVAAGIDTWYLNRIDPAGLPLSLRHELDELQAKASEDEEELDTRWVYDGVPLHMYQAGVSAKQGGGVSWSYILRNNSLTLLIHRSPLGGIIAQARLGSECLARLTDRRALDELDALVRRMWTRPLPFRRGRAGKGQGSTASQEARWQVSQVHLAVDVAHATLDPEQVARYVSRSRSQAVYHAAKVEVEQLLHIVDGEEDTLPPLLTMDWDALYAADSFGAFDGFGFAHGVGHARDEEPVPVEERAMTLHRFGQRISGMTFSPGGAISMVLYDKVLQSRLSGKRHMEPIWSAAGWQPGVPVTRHEARLRRTAVRELGLPGDLRACLDDPWEFLTHKKDVFAAVVGRSEPCPDAVDVAWIRRVMPDETDANRSRWPTDPVWRVVQGATFADAPAQARRLIRRRQRGAGVAVLDTGQFGYLVSRVAQLHPNGGEWTISRALSEALPALEVVEAKKQARTGNDFGELVRERRRQRGLPLPIADKVLPFRAHTHDVNGSDDEPIAPDGEPMAPHWQAGDDIGPTYPRAEHAEARVAEAWTQLEHAEAAGRSRKVLGALEAAYLAEMAVLHATTAPYFSQCRLVRAARDTASVSDVALE
jgi:hypothetical protein